MPISTSPILSTDHNDEERRTMTSDEYRSVLSLDEAIEQWIGDQFGWVQFSQVVIVSFAMVFDAQQTFISVFTGTAPMLSISHSTAMSCNSSANICQISNDLRGQNSLHVSIIYQWGLGSLISSIITSLPTCSYFIGCLVGALVLSSLADSYLGRKKMLAISCLVMSLGGCLAAFSTDIWTYSTLRFVSGIGRASVMTCVLVLATETAGKSGRGRISLIAFSFFSIGFLSLAGIAYVLGDSSWRALYILTAAPGLLYSFVAYFFVFDSPRWLFLRGRQEEAMLVLGRLLQKDSRAIERLASIFYHVCIERETVETNTYSVMRLLVSKRWARRRLLAVVVINFGIAMVYMGMPIGAGGLGLNIYISVALNALIELPASVISYYLINHLHRRSAMLVLTTLSAVFGVACCIIKYSWERLEIVLELTSYFCACTAFDLSLMYVVELFPTCIRNSAMATVRQASFLGAVFSPLVVAAGQDSRFLQYGVFGMTIGLSGLCVLCLPETRDRSMCDTMEEQEYMETTAKSSGGDSL